MRIIVFLLTLSLTLLQTSHAGYAAPRSSQATPGAFNCAAVTEIPQAECSALVALYGSTNGANWGTSTDWLATNTPCNWYGVTCHAEHVTRIELFGNQLNGKIPPALGDLKNLESLFLLDNQLSGAIPIELGNLKHLVGLWIGGNQLSGKIPSQLGNLTSLEYLGLAWNQLTGVIPPVLGNLGNLTDLSLEANQLRGTIPPQLGKLTNLDSLRLYGNQLTGSIPSEFGKFTNLTALDLDNNELSGAIPPELGNLIKLTSLDLSGNQLSGSIPTGFGNLGDLIFLYLFDNQLSGPIPSELGNLDKLTDLDISFNQLGGALPKSFVGLGLTWFWFNNTQLCTPPDTAFQSWLAGIDDWNGTGVVCAALQINYPTGAPGSYFTLEGLGFPANTTVSISINSTPLGTVSTDTEGTFSFLLNTIGTDPGRYVVTASVNPSASALLALDPDEPVRAKQGSGTTFDVPAGIALKEAAYLPLMFR
jgi:hypothetical protein